MMEKKFYYAPVKPDRALNAEELNRPWAHYVAPFRIAPHVWSIGCNDDVSVHLIDTGAGLILIDTGLEQYMHYMIDAIWRLGFKPDDIKRILLSHWHFDHTCGVRLLQEMTGARVYISKEDEAEHQRHKDDTVPLRMLPYTVDAFYDENQPITLGSISITVRPAPGHTPGTAAFFFDDTDETTGKTYHVAMHGGLGVGTMNPAQLAKDGLPESLAHTFVRDCARYAELPVDIVLSGHLNHGNVEPNIPEDRNDYTPFVAPYLWKDLLEDRAAAVRAFYPEVYAPGKNQR